MMRQILKYIAIVLLFFLCAIVQVSLLPYASIVGVTPNLLFVIFFSTLFFQKKQDITFGFFVVALVGFLLDMITPLPFGVSVAILLVIYFMYYGLIRFLQEADANTVIWYYLGTFLGLFLAYYVLLTIASKLLAVPMQFGASTLVTAAYSLVLAAVIFIGWQQIFSNRPENNQLKLF